VAGEAHGAVFFFLLAGLARAQLAEAAEGLGRVLAGARPVRLLEALGPPEALGEDRRGEDRDGFFGSDAPFFAGEDPLGGAIFGGELDDAASDLDGGALGGGTDDKLGAEDLKGARREGEAGVGGRADVSDVGEEAAASEARGARSVVAQEQLGVVIEDQLGAIGKTKLKSSMTSGAEEGPGRDLVADGEGSAGGALGIAAEGRIRSVGGASEGRDLGGPGGASSEETRARGRGRRAEEEGSACGGGEDGGGEEDHAGAQRAWFPGGGRGDNRGCF
jgi:hypothetical protein